jgi:hypothetical protein
MCYMFLGIDLCCLEILGSIFLGFCFSYTLGLWYGKFSNKLMAFDGNSSGFGNAGCIYGGVLWGNWGIAHQDNITRCQAGSSRPFVCIPELRPIQLPRIDYHLESKSFLLKKTMDEISSIGFIGLGLMGLPMVKNLIKKTPEATKFFVYDVVEDTLNRFCDEHSTRAQATKSSREVAEKAVCTEVLSTTSMIISF